MLDTAAGGLSKTEYLRRLIVYGGIKDAPLLSKEDTDQIIQRLSQIGNEIALADYDTADPRDWEELKLALYDVLARLGELPYMGR